MSDENKEEKSTYAVDFTVSFSAQDSIGTCRCIIEATNPQEATQQLMKLSNTDTKVLVLMLPPEDEEWEKISKEMEAKSGTKPEKPKTVPCLINLNKAQCVFIKNVAHANITKAE